MEQRKFNPAIKFNVDVPVKGLFIYDSPLEVETKYGKGYKYAFTDALGERQGFFASPTLHRQLNLIGSLSGKKFTITKVIEKDANGNIKEINGRPSLVFKVEVEGKNDGLSGTEVGFAPKLDYL